MQAFFGVAWWLVVLGRRRALAARRDHRAGAFLWYSALAAIGDLAALWWSATIVFALVWLGEWTLALFATGFLGALALRRMVMEHVTIPLGLPQLTHVLAEIDRGLGGWFGWRGNDPIGVARLAAARALARAGVPEGALTWWQGIQGARIGAYDVAAAALLTDAKGDRAGARALFESLVLLRAPAPQARELAAEWLALDDAEAGRWGAILERAAAIARPGRGEHRRPAALSDAHAGTTTAPGQPLWPATGLTFLLEGVAARLRGDALAPSPLGLWLRWLEAPRHRATWALVRRAAAAGARAVTAPPSVTPSVTPAEPRAAMGALPGAIALHTAALARPDVGTLVAATAAWDAALADVAWRTAIAQRAIALGAPPDAASRAVDELRVQVIDDLADAIVTAAVALPALAERGGGDRGVLGAASARARADLLARLELTLERVGRRVRDRGRLTPIDEWRSFLAVRAAYTGAAAQGGLELERLAFPHAHTELTEWAVWMWNERHEQALSHGMTSWLYERALIVGDAQAIELHGKNAQLEPSAE